MKKAFKWIGGIVVLVVVLLIGIVMGMEHNKSSESASTSQKTEKVATKKKSAPKAKKVAKTSTPTTEEENTSENSDSNDNTNNAESAKQQEKKNYMDVPYTCTWRGNTYSLILKSNGEYLYNFKLAEVGDNTPGIQYEKGTYEVNSAGELRIKSVITNLDARWGSRDDILSTTPIRVYFTGKGSRYAASGNAAESNDFMIMNDGADIQGDLDGIDLKPQQGLQLTDPEQLGPKLKQEYLDSQNRD